MLNLTMQCKIGTDTTTRQETRQGGEMHVREHHTCMQKPKTLKRHVSTIRNRRERTYVLHVSTIRNSRERTYVLHYPFLFLMRKTALAIAKSAKMCQNKTQNECQLARR